MVDWKSCCGCGTKRCGFIFGILTVVCILISALVPLQISQTIDKQLCSNLCIPTPDDEQWKQDAWLTNYNKSRNPLELRSFWLYNIENVGEVEAFGAHPEVKLVGPFVYQQNREKFNVSYNEDFSEVEYLSFENYEFMPHLSSPNVTEDMFIVTVHMPFLGSVNLLSPQTNGTGLPAPLGLWCGAWNYSTGVDQQCCLWNNRTARDLIWHFYSTPLYAGNTDMFPEGRYDETFRLFLTAENASVASDLMMNAHNFGLGGVCHIVNITPALEPFYPDGFCDSGGKYNDSFYAIRQNTGQTDFSKINQYTMWLGNTTIAGRAVGGNDHYQFHKDVQTTDVLTNFDDRLMRPVNLFYLKDSQVTTTRGDIPALRFYPRELLRPDPDDPEPIEGMLNLGYVSSILYGSNTPTSISRPYFYGINQTKYNKYAWAKCVNCPVIPETGWEDFVESVVDIEPNTGKVIGGHKRAQVNAHIGQEKLFSKDCEDRDDDMDDFMYACLKEAWIPVFIFEDGAVLNDENAKLIQDGLSQLKLGKAAILIVRWLFAALAVIFLGLTGFQIMKLQEMDDGYQEMGHTGHE